MDHHFAPRRIAFEPAGPAAMFDTKDVERQRRRADGHDAVLADDAVLLSAGNDFAGQENERALAAIDQDELIYLRADREVRRDAAVARAAHVVALLGDDRIARSQRFIERREIAGVCVLRRDHGEDREILVRDRLGESPAGLRRPAGAHLKRQRLARGSSPATIAATKIRMATIRIPKTVPSLRCMVPPRWPASHWRRDSAGFISQNERGGNSLQGFGGNKREGRPLGSRWSLGMTILIGLSEVRRGL